MRLGRHDVPVTNAERIVFPERGLTKGDVVSYYVGVAEQALPHLRRRPFHMKRFPNGVEGDFFHQKRVPPHPDYVDEIFVKFITGRQDAFVQERRDAAPADVGDDLHLRARRLDQRDLAGEAVGSIAHGKMLRPDTHEDHLSMAAPKADGTMISLAARQLGAQIGGGLFDFRAVARDVVACERCPRLREWCLEVARVKVKRFRDQAYWGRPVPGFGDPKARLLVVGLAPAAHGGNRTGRVFTGDRSGDFLFAALHRAGFASQPTSASRDDGRVAMDGFLALLRDAGRVSPRTRLAFGHGVTHDLGGGLALFTSYHPSQQNTFTGKLTPRGFDAVLKKINRHLDRVGGR